MGRHSSEQSWPFYRSVIGWFIPWAIMAIVVGAAVWIAVDALGNGELDGPRVAVASPSPEASESRSPSASPTPAEPASSPTPKRSKSPEPERSESPEPALITEGITLQILNATSEPSADDLMADRLAQLGFEVVAIDGSSKAYTQTTVFWSFAEAQAAAERLAERFGWVAAPKPANLSSTVDIHVVVGDDEA